MRDEPAAFRFKGLSLRLRTDDLQRTLEFYTGLLDFTVDTLWPEDEPTICILDHGPVHLLFYTGGCEEEGATGCTAQLTLETDGVQALYERLADRVEVLWGPEVYSYGRREFAIRDPDGYELIFSEPTADPPTCEE